MLVKSTLESSDKTFDMNGSLKTGAALAETIGTIQNNRAKLEQAKAEASLQKYSKVTDLIKIAHESKDPAIADSLWKYAIPKTVKALGAGDAFTDEFLETAAKSPETREKVLGYQSEIQDKIAKGMTAQDAVAEVVPTISDPVARAALDTDRILKAQEVHAGEVQMNERNRVTAEAALGKQIQAQGATSSVELSKDLAKKYSEYTAGGGKSGMDSALKRLDGAAKMLDSGDVKTGNITNKIPGLSSDAVQSTLNPKLVEARTNAQAALNTVLRATLGSAFTENEGIRVLNQVWDDKLKPEVNARKLKAKIAELKDNVKNAESEFAKQGLMKPGAKEDTSSFSVGGISMSADQAKAFYKSHPQFKPDAKTKKDLGL
jgi:hypothetical protein